MPDWDVVLAHYREPRVLRTRATATAFHVRSAGNMLVVTTGSGSERPIAPIEMQRAWPFIRRGTPKSEWKRVSDNSSYLESIHDDLREASDPPDDFDAALQRGLDRERIRDQAEEIERLRDRSAQLGDALERLRELENRLEAAGRDMEELPRLRAKLAQADDAKRSLRDQVYELRQKLAEAPRGAAPTKATEPSDDAARENKLASELRSVKSERDRLLVETRRLHALEATLRSKRECSPPASTRPL